VQTLLFFTSSPFLGLLAGARVGASRDLSRRRAFSTFFCRAIRLTLVIAGLLSLIIEFLGFFRGHALPPLFFFPSLFNEYPG